MLPVVVAYAFAECCALFRVFLMAFLSVVITCLMRKCENIVAPIRIYPKVRGFTSYPPIVSKCSRRYLVHSGSLSRVSECQALACPVDVSKSDRVLAAVCLAFANMLRL